jgi:hypothetical protein
MRRFLPVAALCAVVAGLLVAGPWATLAGAGADGSANPATDVCQPMVGNAIVEFLAAPLPAAQHGAWAGHTYTCTYPLTGGQLVLTVDQLRSKVAAKAAYNRLAKATTGRTRLNGLGDAAYQAPNGTLVARKDQFVLNVDPTAAPPGVRGADLAFAAVVAIMGCW